LIVAPARLSGEPFGVHPRPDFRFQGQIGRTYEDSDPPTFPQVVRPPQGAPTCCWSCSTTWVSVEHGFARL